MHKGRVDAHVNFLGSQVHVLVLYGRLSVESCGLGCGVVHQRVVGCVLHGRVDTVGSLSVDGVQTYRVVDSLVVSVDG